MPCRSSLPAFLFALFGILSSVASGEGDRPNILWLSCEDISPHLGCFGDPDASTPNLDRLASEGTKMSHAFTAAGVCAPCRSTIISGMYQTSLGTHHMRCNATLPEHVRPFTQYLREAGYYCTNNSKQDYQFRTPPGTWDESSRKAHWKNRPEGEPFFAVFNFTGCHESGIASESKYQKVTEVLSPAERQDPADLELPPYYPDTPVTREDWKRNYELITAMDKWAGGLIEELKEAGLYEETIIWFWSDHGVGLPRAKRWLYDSGTHIPMIVRIPERYRHGAQAAPGTTDDQLISSVDFAPTVLKLAGIDPPDYMQGRAFLGPELSPQRDYVYGARDRMDERYDIIRSVRDRRYRYIRNYEPWKAYYQYMNTPEKGATMQELRRVHAAGQLPAAAALFMAEEKPLEELYDLQADPHEVNNLIESPEHQEILRRMRAAHQQWTLETRDLGLIPESEINIRRERFGSDWAILNTDHQGASATELMSRVAAVATHSYGAAADAEELVAATRDDDPAVRYWGWIGLGNLRQPAEDLDALNDPSPAVRVAASRAILRAGTGNVSDALATLTDVLAGPHQWARLRAAIVLDEADELARPVIPQLKAALENQPNKYIVRVANRALNELQGTDHQVP